MDLSAIVVVPLVTGLVLVGFLALVGAVRRSGRQMHGYPKGEPYGCESGQCGLPIEYPVLYDLEDEEWKDLGS